MLKDFTRISKKVLCIAFVLIFSTNCFAAIVSDNDGSAFITKAEFDSLKNDFQTKLDSYNTQIDNKIDAAIASYLAGIKAEKTSSLPLNNDIRKIRCMYYHTDTETKDLVYVYCAPKISGAGTDWTCGYSGTTEYGTYCHDFVWNAKSSYTKTGERNMINNLYINTSNHWKSSAEWVGHYKNVIDVMTLTYSGSRLNSNYGNHEAHATNQMEGLVSPANSLIYNSPVTDDKWNVGTLLLDNKFTDGSSTWQAAWNANKDITVGGYTLDTTDANFTNKDVNLIIWQPETYYGFTPIDQKFFGFDKVARCGSTSKTTGPTLHETYSPNSALSFWPASVGSSIVNVGYSQSNLSTYAYYKTCQLGTAMYNCDNKANVSSLIRSTSYNKTNNRWIWPYPSFPYNDIMDWYQLYLKSNDWALKSLTTLPTDGTVRTDSSSKSHLSLNAGWPIIKLKKDYKYEVEVGFEETDKDHLLFLNYGPYDITTAVTTETTHTIKQADITHNGQKTTTYPNAIKVEKTKKVKFSFVSKEDSVLFLKWCDDKTSGSLNGGGTIVLPDNIIETKLD